LRFGLRRDGRPRFAVERERLEVDGLSAERLSEGRLMAGRLRAGRPGLVVEDFRTARLAAGLLRAGHVRAGRSRSADLAAELRDGGGAAEATGLDAAGGIEPVVASPKTRRKIVSTLRSWRWRSKARSIWRAGTCDVISRLRPIS